MCVQVTRGEEKLSRARAAAGCMLPVLLVGSCVVSIVEL